ncbi:unnamed protein product, partial [Mesorhabditis belari]|uniref:Tyrosinase copper-binding domain-containing protein n=1 Tax=Mesorhabditis belari TaxID=2138241 RepID=A0AAF3FHG4_9BILA
MSVHKEITIFLLLFFFCTIPVNGKIQQTPIELSSLCRSLPRASFLKAQQVDLICNHYAHWHHERDEPLTTGKWSINETTDNQKRYLRDLEDCARSGCTTGKGHTRLKRETKKSMRKEIRLMSQQEREKLFEAMNKLKSKQVDNINAWDLHTLVHYPDSAPGAHWGPAFLPWHREFLRQFEVALQKEVPGVAMAYWDSTLDQGLPDPADSVLWTDELMGNGNGYVKTGPFKDWDTNVLMPLSQVPVKKLYRMTGGRAQDRLMSPRDVEWILSRSKFENLVFCHDTTFESIHGLSHAWVGGFMFVIRVSPNDPAFYMHHAFIDNLWEQFRHRRQNRWQRENDWSRNSCNRNQDAYAQMKPFSMTNRDGLSNNYTDLWYEYEPVVHCTESRPYCDSPYLWCDEKLHRCRSRIVRGGNCTGFEGTSICYESVCIRNVCQLPPEIAPQRQDLVQHANLPNNVRRYFGLTGANERANSLREEIPSRESLKWTPPKSVTRRPAETVWAKTIMLDRDARGLADTLATVTVHDRDIGDNYTAYIEPITEYPEIPGLLYLPLLKPHPEMVHNLALIARDGFGRICQAQCYNDTIERYQVCDPKISLSMRADVSAPMAYTHSMANRKYLDTDLSVHPLRVHPSVPYIVFACTTKVLTSAQVAAVGEALHPKAPTSQLIWFRVAVHRSDRRNMQIEVIQLDDWRDPWFSAVDAAASPFDPTIIFAKAPNPEHSTSGMVRVMVNLFENNERIQCPAKCTLEDGSMIECDGQVELSIDPNRGDEPVWSGDEEALPVLGWDMRGHPTRWRHRMPYLSFIC